MSQFDLSRAHKCSAVPGCSNKAVYYSRSQNHCVLFCKYHRMGQCCLNSDGTTFENMFTTPKNTTCEEIADSVDLSYSIHSKAMTEIFVYDDFDLEDLKYLKLAMDCMFKEVRLYSFYKKFAHFQVPNIEEIEKYPKTIVLRKDMRKILVFYKQLFMGLLMNLPRKSPLRKVMREYANLHLKIIPKIKENTPEVKRLRETFIFNLLFFQRLSFRDIEFLSLFYVFTILPLCEAINSPGVLDHVDKSRRPAYKIAVKMIVEKFGIEPRPPAIYKGYKYYLDTGVSLHKIGDLKKALYCFLKALMCKNSASEINKLTAEEKIQIYYCIGLLYYDLSVHKKAILNLEHYLEKQTDESIPNRITSMKYLALAYAHLTDFSKSKEIYDEFKLEFSKKERIEIRALFYYMSGNYFKSLAIYDKMFIDWKEHFNFVDRALYPIFIDQRIAMLKHGMLEHTAKMIYCRNGKSFKDLKREYELCTILVSKNHPIFAEYHNYMAYSLEILGKYDEALKYLKSAKGILKNNYQEESLIYIQSLLQSASLYLHKNDIQMAKKDLKSIKNIQDGYPGYIKDLKEIYVLEGRIYLQEKLIDEARSHFWELTRIETQRSGFYSFHVAHCYQLIAETYMDEPHYLRKYYKKSRRILVSICDHSHPEVFRNTCLYLESLTKAGAKEKGFRLAERSKTQLHNILSADSSIVMDFLVDCYAKIQQFLQS